MKAFIIILLIAAWASWYWYYNNYYLKWKNIIIVNLNKEFTLNRWETALLEASDFSVKLENLIKMDCDPKDCIMWNWLSMRYKKSWEELRWINLYEAFWHKIEMKQTDFINSAKFIIVK